MINVMSNPFASHCRAAGIFALSVFAAANCARAADGAGSAERSESAWIALARGRVEPPGGIIQIAAGRDGVIKEILVNEGDRVEKDTTLAIMEAGEKTGTLSNAINTAVEYYQARAGIVKVLLGTAIFTAVEMGFSILSLIANRVAVLPAIEKEVTDGASPEKIAAIKRGISVAYFANDLMLVVSVIGIVFAAVCTYGYMVGGSAFRQKIDDIILRIPQVKDIIVHAAIANSSKVAISLIRGGVDLMASLTIAEKSSRVPRIVNYWRGATKRIEDGEDIATALAQNPLENSERTLVRSHTDRSQLARAFEVIAERREVLALRAAKKFQVFSFFATLAFSLVAVLIALAVALIQNEGLMSTLNAQ